jgi:hypothetical protein
MTTFHLTNGQTDAFLKSLRTRGSKFGSKSVITPTEFDLTRFGSALAHCVLAPLLTNRDGKTLPDSTTTQRLTHAFGIEWLPVDDCLSDPDRNLPFDNDEIAIGIAETLRQAADDQILGFTNKSTLEGHFYQCVLVCSVPIQRRVRFVANRNPTHPVASILESIRGTVASSLPDWCQPLLQHRRYCNASCEIHERALCLGRWRPAPSSIVACLDILTFGPFILAGRIKTTKGGQQLSAQ